MKLLTRRLALFAVIDILVVQAVLVATSEDGWRDTVLRRTQQFVIQEEFADSWDPMFEAYEFAIEDDSTPLYQKIFFEKQTKFQYAPTALLFVPVLRQFLPEKRWTGAPAGRARWISWSFVVLAVAATVSIALHAVPGASGAERITLGLVVTGLALFFFPLVRAYQLGQLQTWINGLVAAALACWLARRETAAGILTGLVCLMKPTYALILIWALVRRRGEFLAGALAGVLPGLAASIAIFGWANHVDYLRVLGFLARHGESFFANQSVNGLTHRLLQNGPNLKWEWTAFPPYHPLVYGLTLASSLVLIGLLFWVPRLRNRRISVFEFALAILTATMASPIAWDHHYGVLLPIYALLLTRAGRPRTGAWLAASWLLTANFIQPVELTAPFLGLNLLQSHMFFGALIVLTLLYAALLPRADARPG